MTWTANLRVEDVSDGPAPIDVLATASVEDGNLFTNTEKLRSVEVKFVLEADETSLKAGDTLHANGHFNASEVT